MEHELYGKKVSESFFPLVQYIGGNYYDGSGNLLDISTGISLLSLESSINYIKANYIPDASLGEDFYWEDGSLGVDINVPTEFVSKTIYVETTGSDTTGDGTIGNPFATPLKALQNIKPIILNCDITVALGAGTFTWDNQCKREITQLSIDGGDLIIQGTYSTVYSGVTTVETSQKMVYDCTFTGTVAEDDLVGYFLADGANLMPISYNTAGTDSIQIEYPRAERNKSGVTIVQMDTILSLEDKDSFDSDPISQSYGTITWKWLNFKQEIQFRYAIHPKEFEGCLFDDISTTPCLSIGAYSLYCATNIKIRHCSFISTYALASLISFRRFFGVVNIIQSSFYSQHQATGAATIQLELFSIAEIICTEIVMRGNKTTGSFAAFKMQRHPRVHFDGYWTFRNYTHIFYYDPVYQPAGLEFLGGRGTYVTDKSVMQFNSVTNLFERVFNGVNFSVTSIDGSSYNMFSTGEYIVNSPGRSIYINIPDVSTDMDLLNYKITNLGFPEDASDATNKAYVDSSIINLIRDVSLKSSDFYWSGGYLEVSTGFGGPTFTYVDSSLVVRDAYNIIQDTSAYVDFNQIEASIALKLNNTTDTFTGILSIDGCLGVNIVPEFTVDVSGSARFGNIDVIGQSIIGYGLIINNEQNATEIGDFQVKSRNYNVIDVDASEDSILINDASGKIGFFGETPSVQSTGWSVTNVSENKIYDGDNTSVAELIDVLGTLINELKTKGIIG